MYLSQIHGLLTDAAENKAHAAGQEAAQNELNKWHPIVRLAPELERTRAWLSEGAYEAAYQAEFAQWEEERAHLLLYQDPLCRIQTSVDQPAEYLAGQATSFLRYPLPPDGMPDEEQLESMERALAHFELYYAVIPDGKTLKGRYRRLCTVGWWIRLLRKRMALAVEEAWRRYRPLAYEWCSPDLLSQQKIRDGIYDRFREKYKVEDVESGHTFPLPTREEKARRAYGELMARVMGVAELAEERGLQPHLYTVTVPAHMHPRRGERANPGFDGTSPKEAHHWFQERWARCRADLGRSAFPYEYIKTIQPHRCGTPHYHIMFWTSHSGHRAVEASLRLHMEATQEHGAARHRHGVDVRELQGDGDEAKRFLLAAVGYIARHMKSENGDREATSAAAWASGHGVRRFSTSQKGITLYRELRRPDVRVTGASTQVQNAARAGRFADFIRTTANSPLRLSYQDTTDGYGDPAQRIDGVLDESTGEIFMRQSERRLVMADPLEIGSDRTVVENDQGQGIARNTPMFKDSLPLTGKSSPVGDFENCGA